MENKDFTILIIEDEAKINEVIAEMLSIYSYTVHQAADGKVGLQAIRGVQPHLVVCDVELPYMSGLDIFSAIDEDQTLDKKPDFIFISAGDFQDQMPATDHPRFCGFIPKPFNNKVLLNAIQDCLKTSKQLRS